jgi:hypothetical protein
LDGWQNLDDRFFDCLRTQLMFGWLVRRRKLQVIKVEVVYGFEGLKVDRLAEALSSILRVPLYPHQSPMIGLWYSSCDLAPIAKALREGHHGAAKEATTEVEEAPYFEIVLNDPDPYHGPEIPGGGECLLRIIAAPHELSEVQKRLRRSGLVTKKFRRTQMMG